MIQLRTLPRSQRNLRIGAEIRESNSNSKRWKWITYIIINDLQQNHKTKYLTLHEPFSSFSFQRQRKTSNNNNLVVAMGVSFLSISTLPSLHPLGGSRYPKTTSTRHQPRSVSLWFSCLCYIHNTLQCM